jgi:acetolactate synthase small subunit
VLTALRRRNHKLLSFSSGPSDIPGASVLTFVMAASADQADLAYRQLSRLPDVIYAVHAPSGAARELILVKVPTTVWAELTPTAPAGWRVLASSETVTDLEFTGAPEAVEEFLNLLPQFGVHAVRSGPMVLPDFPRFSGEQAPAQPDVAAARQEGSHAQS